MGKKSRERMTGRTSEQRAKSPRGLRHDDVMKEEKMQRRDQKIVRMFAQLFHSGAVRIGKAHTHLEVKEKHD